MPFQKKIYSLLSFGWSGRAKDWQRFEEVSLVLAGLATPLVLSVHTIVSFDLRRMDIYNRILFLKR